MVVEKWMASLVFLLSSTYYDIWNLTIVSFFQLWAIRAIETIQPYQQQDLIEVDGLAFNNT